MALIFFLLAQPFEFVVKHGAHRRGVVRVFLGQGEILVFGRN